MARPVSGCVTIERSDEPQALVDAPCALAGLTVKASPANAVELHVGAEGCVGCPLAPGESATLPEVDLDRLYVEGNAGDRLGWIGAMTDGAG